MNPNDVTALLQAIRGADNFPTARRMLDRLSG
jgi:hypothetical protein